MYSKDTLIAALQLRYDAYSAGAVLEIARQRAEIADKPTYDANEVRTLRAAIETAGDRVGRVLDAIDDLLASAPPAPDQPSPEAAKRRAAEPAAPVDTRVETAAAPADEVSPAVDAPGETTIVLAGLETDDEEAVLLCGASELLGDWDPARARPMARDGKHWLAQIPVPPGAELAFKFIRRTADGDVSWEPGEDRTLVAKPRIEVTWR